MGTDDRDSRAVSGTRAGVAMRILRAMVMRLSGLTARHRADQELQGELEAHVGMHIEDNVRTGMTPIEARRRARLALGGVEHTKEAYRDRRGIPLIETIAVDAQFAVRI